jgi:deazaflavin-dependent oxidoreductase (nitroreductase family)
VADGVLYALKRWMYRGNRPGRLARAMNWLSAVQFKAGVLSPRRAVTIEVLGRRSGRVVSVPVIVVELHDARFLVSMLGEDVNWVRNVRAAGGHAVVHRGRRTPVVLEEVAVAQRAPILRRYLALAPGARPHMPVSRHAPVEAFEAIADRYPVFKIVES